MRILQHGIIYENPLPQLSSRQSVFPSLCQIANGDILASHVIGEAFESVNATTHLSISRDGGRTFSLVGAMFEGKKAPAYSDGCKVTRLPDGRLCALGYAFDRKDPALPIGNPQTGGLLEDILFVSFSLDNGASWEAWRTLDCAWGRHVEASAPLYALSNGSWVTPITGFASWEGNLLSRNCGRLLRSDDRGKTFSDHTICMAFEGDEITCFEQRLCELASGTLVCIGWNENMRTGERLPNHYTISTDGGKTFSRPMSTGIWGQASNVCAVGGERLLALHSVRRDTAQPGIYAYIVNLANGAWEIEEELLLWKSPVPVEKDASMAEIFAYLKFGQPSAVVLDSGEILCCYWKHENGQYQTATVLMEL